MAFVSNDCIKKVNDKLKSGILFRYHEKKPLESSIVKAEHKLAKIVNKKYGCAINSCGCALFLALKAMGVSAGTKVLVNAFTFDAVPAAIHHCQAEAILVECTPELTIDFSRVSRNTLVTDLVYNPVKTKFLKLAEEEGLKIVDGFGMLLHQAVPGFLRWFGKKPIVTKTLRQKILSL